MNVKFGGLEEGALLVELQELDKIRKQKKTVDEYMWKNLGKNKRINSTPVTKKKKEGSFLLHPQRLSDSESSESSSPKLNSSSSGASNFERDKVRLDTNTLNIKNNREKLHENFTYTNRNPFIYDIDLNIGESCTVTQKKDGIINTKKENVNMSNKNQTNNKNAPPPVPKIVITDGMVEKKCKSFIEKSLHVISDIRFQMQKGISPPDGDEDITRRQLRVKEFSNRFSRNYLYPIGRQLSDLSKAKSSSTQTNQKLFSAYQIVLNGLTAYHNHLPTSIGVCSSDKLKLLLKNLLELCDIHSRLKTDNQHDLCDFINIFRQSAEFTIEKIEDHFFAISTDSMAKSHATKNTLQQPKETKNTAAEGNKAKKNSLAAKLSMYNTTSNFRRDAMWRKMTESVRSKSKLHSVKSRYKTAAFRHRPPAEKVQDNMLRLPISRCKLLTKKSSGILKKTPVMTPVNEDNITTMVQIERMRSSTDDNERMSNHHRQHHQGQDGKAPQQQPQTQPHPQEDIVVQLLQLVLDINRRKAGGHGEEAEGKEPGSGAADKMAEVVEKLRKEGSVPEETLLRITEELKTKNHKEQSQGGQQQLELKLVTFKGGNLYNSEGKKKKKRKEPTVTVTGAKNAKLICIQDDNSADEDSDSGAKDCETDEEDRAVKVVTSTSQTQTDLDKADKCTQRSDLKMRRSKKKQPKCLKMLPKEYAVNVIQYKLDYKKYQKNNPMYRKTQNIVPWKLMGEMSDDILDGVLLGVTKEIELDEVLEPIYQSELQL